MDELEGGVDAEEDQESDDGSTDESGQHKWLLSWTRKGNEKTPGLRTEGEDELN